MPANPGTTTATSVADAPRFISPRELALRWRVSRTSVDRIAERAHLTKYLLGSGRNGTIRFRLDEVERFESAAAVPSQGRL